MSLYFFKALSVSYLWNTLTLLYYALNSIYKNPDENFTDGLD